MRPEPQAEEYEKWFAHDCIGRGASCQATIVDSINSKLIYVMIYSMELNLIIESHDELMVGRRHPVNMCSAQESKRRDLYCICCLAMSLVSRRN